MGLAEREVWPTRRRPAEPGTGLPARRRCVTREDALDNSPDEVSSWDSAVWDDPQISGYCSLQTHFIQGFKRI